MASSSIVAGMPQRIRLGGAAYAGSIPLGIGALAMVATLPGRTQGLGLITEPRLAGLGILRPNGFVPIHVPRSGRDRRWSRAGVVARPPAGPPPLSEVIP